MLYFKVVKFLLAPYGTDDVNAKLEMNTINIKQPDSQNTVEYAQYL